MNLRALATLALLDRVGSFTQAATSGNMTLSAVSMQMKTLEAELGAALFDRASRPPRLTPLGRRLARHAARILEEESAIRNACSDGESLTGSFRIGVIQSAAVRLIPATLHRSPRSAPLATFEFVSGLSQDLGAEVLAGHLDAAIVTRVGGEDLRLRFDRLASDEMVVAMPKDRTWRTLSEAMRDDVFLHFNPQSGIGKIIAQALLADGLKPAKVLSLDNVEATMECVRRKVGFTILPGVDVERYADDDVLAMPFGTGPFSRELSLATRDEPLTERWRNALVSLLAPEDEGSTVRLEAQRETRTTTIRILGN